MTASDVDAGSTLSFAIIGGADADVFSLTNGTFLRITEPRNFEVPADANGDNTYEVTIEVSDGALSVVQPLTVTVTDENDPPVITSASSLALAEGSLAVGTLQATDEDGDVLSLSIQGGVDGGAFDVVGATGALIKNFGANFENPNDANLDGIFELTVAVSDGDDSTLQPFLVTIEDVNEAPVFSIDDILVTTEEYVDVSALSATDPDAGDVLSYSIIGGSDQALFELHGSDLSFVTAPDFEGPNDADFFEHL